MISEGRLASSSTQRRMEAGRHFAMTGRISEYMTPRDLFDELRTRGRFTADNGHVVYRRRVGSSMTDAERALMVRWASELRELGMEHVGRP